jgi:hypothetical protein
MLFLFLIGLLVGYVAVAVMVTVVLVKMAAEPRRKAIVGFLSGVTFLLIPVWDMIPGQRYFKRLCETEAGIKIYKTVDEVDGFREYSGGPGDDAVKEYGYRFIEMERPGVGLLRVTLGPDGRAIRQPVSEAISQYAVREIREDLDWNVRKVQQVIFDQRTGERLGTFTIFYYSGNWLQVKLSWLWHHAPCGNELSLSKSFYPSVLKPIAAMR